MADLAATGGQVALNERKVTEEEIGKPLAAIGTGVGHRIYRGNQIFGFWEAETRSLERGDQIVEVVPRLRS